MAVVWVLLGVVLNQAGAFSSPTRLSGTRLKDDENAPLIVSREPPPSPSSSGDSNREPTQRHNEILPATAATGHSLDEISKNLENFETKEQDRAMSASSGSVSMTVKNGPSISRSKGPQVFIYDIPSRFNTELVGQRHTNDEMVEFEQGFLELLRNSDYVTSNKAEATHFLIPAFPVTYCAVLKARENSLGCSRSRSFLIEALAYVKTNHPLEWNRRSGADHLIFSPYDWGSCFATFEKDAKEWGRLPELERARSIGFLGLEHDSPGNCYSSNDIIMPPYVSQRVRSLLNSAQRPPNDLHDVYFRGRIDNSEFRAQLVNTYASEKASLVSQDSVSSKQFAEELLSSKFCVVPHGFAPWSFRYSEAVLAGCLPVLTQTGNLKLPCENLIHHSTFALLVSGDSVSAVKYRVDHLLADPKRVDQMRANLKKSKEFFEYGPRTLECFVSQIYH